MVSEKEIDKDNFSAAMATVHSLGLPNKITQDGATFHHLMVAFEGSYNSSYNHLKEEINKELNQKDPSFTKLLNIVERSGLSPGTVSLVPSSRGLKDIAKRSEAEKKELFASLGSTVGILLAAGAYAFTSPYALAIAKMKERPATMVTLINVTANGLRDVGFQTRFLKIRFKEFERILKQNFKSIIRENKKINNIPARIYIQNNKAEKHILTNLKEITKCF